MTLSRVYLSHSYLASEKANLEPRLPIHPTSEFFQLLHKDPVLQYQCKRLIGKWLIWWPQILRASGFPVYLMLTAPLPTDPFPCHRTSGPELCCPTKHSFLSPVTTRHLSVAVVSYVVFPISNHTLFASLFHFFPFCFFSVLSPFDSSLLMRLVCLKIHTINHACNTLTKTQRSVLRPLRHCFYPPMTSTTGFVICCSRAHILITFLGPRCFAFVGLLLH